MATYQNGTTQSAPPSISGFDSDTVISASAATVFVNNGFRFCIRYLTTGTTESTADLTFDEAQTILAAGLCLMPVQHVRDSGWMPSGTLGTSDGQNTRAHALNCGFPAHVNVWLDLEGVSTKATAQDVIDYCQNWYTEVAAWGYVPGLYVGADSGLNSLQLYQDLSFAHYWRSLSGSTPSVDVTGYEMIQSAGGTLSGVGYDNDVTQNDNSGNAVQWLAPN